jgi:methylglyoxal synthase
LIFFIDPLTTLPHDVHVKASMRLATIYETGMALNRAAAEPIIGHENG